MNNLPERSDDWTDKQREFVRLYTDPTLESYMMPTVAAELAGFTSGYGSTLLKEDHIRDEVERIFEQRVLAGRDLAEMLWDNRYAALRTLIDGLHAGEALRIIDPEEEFGEGMKDVLQPILDDDGNVALTSRGKPAMVDHTGRLREINRHNKVKVDLLKEARNHAELIMAYNLGTPEQVVRHKNDDTPDARTFKGMSREELLESRELLEKALSGKGQGEPPPRLSTSDSDDEGDVVEADYEVVED